MWKRRYKQDECLQTIRSIISSKMIALTVFDPYVRIFLLTLYRKYCMLYAAFQ